LSVRLFNVGSYLWKKQALTCKPKGYFPQEPRGLEVEFFQGGGSTLGKRLHTGRLRQQQFLPVNDLIRVQLKLLA